MTGAVDGPDAVELHRLLESVNAEWSAMLDRTTPVTRRLRIAEQDIDVVLVGDEIADLLLPSLEWHADATGPPSATVGAWDAAATGTALPVLPPSKDPLVRQWVARRDGRPMAGVDGMTPGMVHVGNRYARRHLLGVAGPEVLRSWETGAPLRRQLWWALAPEVLFVHAGAVGDADGVALIMGAAGSGKSTTSLACLGAGMGFLSDDYCLVRGDPPVAHLLAATARVHEHEVAGLGPLAATAAPRTATEGPRAKALLHLHRSVPERLVRSAPVRVVLIPEVTDEPSPRLAEVSAAEALRAVAPAALWQLHIDAAHELAGLRRLLTAVPSYRLRLSRHRDANPPVIQEVLARTRTRCPAASTPSAGADG